MSGNVWILIWFWKLNLFDRLNESEWTNKRNRRLLMVPLLKNKGTSNRKWQVMNISTCITEQPFRSKWDYISRNSQLNIELLRKRRVFLLTRKYGTHNSKMNSKITCSKAVQQQAEFISINYCSFRSWTSELQYWKEWPRWIF